MKKLLIIFFVFASAKCYCQNSISFYLPKYPPKDTLKCHFTEVLNDSTYKWQSGYVVMENGMFSFGEGNKKTFVEQQYLPITSGVVSSALFYNDMLPIKNYAINIVIAPIIKKETTTSH